MTIEEINTAKAKLKLDLLDLEVKQKIASAATNTATPKSSNLNPVIATIIVGILTFLGSAVGTALQGYFNMNIEKQKFESSLITEGLKNGTQKDKLQYLGFLKTSKLVTIKDLNIGIDSIIKDSLTKKIPDTKTVANNNATAATEPTAVALPINPRIYLQIANNTQEEQAKKLKSSLTKQGYIVPGIENISKTHPNVNMPVKMEVRYCYTEDTTLAKDIISIIKSQNFSVDVYPAFNKPSIDDHPKHIEIWFPRN